MESNDVPPVLDSFDALRIETVRRMIRGKNIATRPDLGPEDRFAYVIGGLACDENGFVSHEELDRAWTDRRIVAAAHQLLSEAGWAGVAN